MDVEAWTQRMAQGDARALARLLTIVEDGDPLEARRVVAAVAALGRSSPLVALTGAPGVGKSTLAAAMVAAWRRRGSSVAVLAVDPTSPLTGGALLGDRVRLQDHALDPGVFVRSMASRGRLGGLAAAVPLALDVFEAAGYDVVLLETVGVGQAEVDVAAVADCTVVAVAPGAGDAVQAAKAGVLEIADVLCVNKADRHGADRTARELEDVQGRAESAAPIVRTQAVDGEGVDDLLDVVAARLAAQTAEERGERRRGRAVLEITELALDRVRRRLAGPDAERLAALAADVADGRLDAPTAADRLAED